MSVTLLVIWLVVAEFAAIGLTVVVMLRKAPPLTTQVDKTTGIKEHGIGRWLLVLSAVCTSLPILALLSRAVFAVYERFGPTVLDYWWAPLLVLALAAVGIGGWLIWSWEKPAPVVVEAPVIAPSPPPAPMWSMPAGQTFARND